MRKQTKIAVVASAAALLAMGAAMTSYAGWEQEDGEWVYLDKDGDRVYDTWKKSNGNYYYLNEDGVMATDTIVEYDGNKFYVDATGKKVMNQWVEVENEDDEEIGGYSDISTIWYYFGSSGKAYKSDIKSVNYAGGKGKFAFDENGYMLSGWQELDGALYYFGTEDEGWAYTGWQYLEPEINDETYDDEEWFYFGSNGKATRDAKKYISGQYYTFDENGIMEDRWVTGTPGATASGNSARYNAENGNLEKGWVQTYRVTDTEEEGSKYWFYLDSKGEPFNYKAVDANATAVKKDNEKWKAAEKNVAAKVIKGKTYLFNNKGEMQTGVYQLTDVARTGSSADLGVDDADNAAMAVYYFGKDGAMVTGKTSVTYDGDTYYYYFQKDGKAYMNTIADGAYYNALGERVDAVDGNNYALVDVTDASVKGSTAKVTGTVIVSSNGKVKKSGTVKLDGYKYTLENYVIKSTEAID